ncbi:hypothetical protein F8271_08635 [Micromonospora sp. ALFpr18c]|uniref:hypothetical protein n=1 Tax=Micromonospora sp. ALFpr18c TaxID=1458665 RepID=UPI00124B5634|nr:hypothetical protein [Micromonospora sp. ALFpr18c]KAB1944868.1 hypothetical protein F8271_08635 [Micromonospora sp. ALFpr18c]
MPLYADDDLPKSLRGSDTGLQKFWNEWEDQARDYPHVPWGERTAIIADRADHEASERIKAGTARYGDHEQEKSLLVSVAIKAHHFGARILHFGSRKAALKSKLEDFVSSQTRAEARSQIFLPRSDAAQRAVAAATNSFNGLPLSAARGSSGVPGIVRPGTAAWAFAFGDPARGLHPR